MESFFSHLKTEAHCLYDIRTVDEVQRRIKGIQSFLQQHSTSKETKRADVGSVPEPACSLMFPVLTK